MAEHSPVAPLIFQANTGWQHGADLCYQGALLLFCPVGRYCKIYAVGVCFNQGHAALAQSCQYLIEYFAPAPRHFTCGGTIGKEGHRTGSHIAICGINKQLHRSLRCFMRIGFYRTRRSDTSRSFMTQAQVGQTSQYAEQHMQMVASWTNLEAAH